MKRLLLLLFLCLPLIGEFSCDTERSIDNPADQYFIKYYGEDGNQSGVDLIQVDDGLLLLGNTQFNGTKNIFLVKVNSRGEELWKKTLGGGSDVAIDIEPTLDGNFVILAAEEISEEDHDVKLIVVSPAGDEIISSVYGSASKKKETPKSVTPLVNGGYIVTGITVADNTTDPSLNPDLFSNIFHFRCDASLKFDNSNWREYYGSTIQIDGAVKTLPDPAGKFFVFGYSDQIIKPQQQGKLTMIYYRIGAGGTVDSEQAILGDEAIDIRADYVHKVDAALGGGFLIVGTSLNPSGVNTLHAARLRENLQFNPVKDEQFDKDFPVLTTSIEAVSATSSLVAPQGFLLLGEELRTLGNTKNLSLTKIDQSGQLIWTVSLGSEEENDRAAAVVETIDEKILVLGTVELGDNQTKMALFKLNSTGRLHD